MLATDTRDTFIAPPANPGGSTTVTLWDSTWDVGGKKTSLTRRGSYSRIKRCVVRIFVDQNATFLAQDISQNSSTWRTFNNAGAGETVTANTWFESDQLLPGHDHRVQITTGTAPTTWEVEIRLVPERPLGQ